MVAQVEPTTLPDQVFEQLLAAVLDGRYAPGQRLPSQRALAAGFGVNVGSLRAAVDRLAQLRLVEVRHGEPMRVADWRSAAGLELLAHAAIAEPALLEGVFEARALLLTEAARLAALRAGARQRRELAELAAAFVACTDDERRQDLDLDFMASVIAASGNIVFRLILNSLRAAYEARRADFRPIAAAVLGRDYARVAAAITRGDRAAAGRAMAALTARQFQLLTAGA